jgi:hypothetical protein
MLLALGSTTTTCYGGGDSSGGGGHGSVLGSSLWPPGSSMAVAASGGAGPALFAVAFPPLPHAGSAPQRRPGRPLPPPQWLHPLRGKRYSTSPPFPFTHSPTYSLIHAGLTVGASFRDGSHPQNHNHACRPSI